MTYFDQLAPPTAGTEAQVRTISAWGEDCHVDLVRRRVGVIGAGSVGGFVAESLARTGFEDILIMDYDTIELLNLDRLSYATRADIGELKAEALKRRLEQIATADGFRAEALIGAVYEEDMFRAALDCDMLFACVDRPWGRYALNVMAYGHLVPVFDGGIAVRTNRRKQLVSADWRAHTATPGRACLQCLGQYDPGLVQSEREGYLDDPHYIEGLPKTHALKMRENVAIFSASCASLQSLQMLELSIAPLDQSNPGAQRYHFVGGFMEEPRFPECESWCDFPGLIARGDHAGLLLTGARPKPKR
jgi:molybdopterin/thiamine biosynthesis adenylyltransferase